MCEATISPLIAPGALIFASISMLWHMKIVQKLQERVGRLGRAQLFLNYEYLRVQQRIPPVDPDDFVAVACEMLRFLNVHENPKMCSAYLEDWNCSLSEFKEVAKRINLSNKG